MLMCEWDTRLTLKNTLDNLPIDFMNRSGPLCTLLIAVDFQWWAKLLRLLTVNSLSYFVKIKY
jgi:hypothetical protein